ncbi:MAG TPA: hypothetical protein VI260_06170 [Blastocatellia bacterium]|jgi:hypothetical protein
MASEQEYKDRVEAPVSGTTTLYRPVGQQELDLIRSSGFREFPPRLPRQPIFYPVLNEEYATQIARDWNTKSGSRRGFVTRFQVPTEILRRYEINTVGSSIHQEYWIPAEDLPEFNRNIVGVIEVIAEYQG